MRSSSVVRTKQQLQTAVDQGASVIEVRGEFAEQLSKALQLSKVSSWTLRFLSISLAAIPFTGGLSAFAAAPVAVLSGLEIALIIAVLALGISLVLLILKEYDVVTTSVSPSLPTTP